MAEERDTGLLAPLAINRKAYKYARDLRKQEDTNYDEIDNKYDAIRHIGGALALYSQYPDMASDVILEAKEIFSGDTARGTEMDRHNNAIARKLYEMLPEEQADQLTTEQALEIAKSYVEEWELAEEEGREIDLPDDMKPIYYYKEGTKNTEMRQGGGIETEAGKEMAQEKFQLDRQKADLNKDGELSEYEKVRGEAIQRTMDEGKETKMAEGGGISAQTGYASGMMSDPFAPFQVVIGIDEESGNEVPAGSKDEEVRDDIPAMLSEGEYVVPADVVRWHGLKTFEALRCEAKHNLGLMAMHDRISMVDDETKEPVEYEIEEDDKPEVEEAEVKVIKAAEGTDVQPTPQSPTTFYQLRYVTDPVTGRTKMAYVDPLTGQEVSPAEYEEERATRFAPQTVLERDILGKAVGEEEDVTPEVPECPEGFVLDPTTNTCVPEVVQEVTDFTDSRGSGEEAPAPGPSYGYTTEELDLTLEQSLPGYTAPTALPGYVSALGPLGVIATGVKAVSDYFTRNSALDQIRAGENLGVAPTGDYGSWRSDMNNAVAGSVAITEREARDITGSDDPQGSIQGSSFGSVAEAEAVADSGWGSDEHFDAIESGFTANEEATPSTPGDSMGNTDTDTSPGESPTGDDTEGTPFAKGGMPYRKVQKRTSMINYSKGNK